MSRIARGRSGALPVVKAALTIGAEVELGAGSVAPAQVPEPSLPASLFHEVWAKTLMV